jgi:hypothetical protein
MNFSPTVSIGSKKKKKGEYSHTKLNKKIDYVTICQRYVATFVQKIVGICKEMEKKKIECMQSSKFNYKYISEFSC